MEAAQTLQFGHVEFLDHCCACWGCIKGFSGHIPMYCPECAERRAEARIGFTVKRQDPEPVLDNGGSSLITRLGKIVNLSRRRKQEMN